MGIIKGDARSLDYGSFGSASGNTHHSTEFKHVQG